MELDDYISTAEAAETLGLADAAVVRAMIAAGKIPALKRARDWWILRADLDRVSLPGRGWPAGKPRKKARRKSS